MNNQLKEKVIKFVNDNRENIIKDICDIVSIKSVKGEAEENAPFGIGPKNALDKALEISTRLGLDVVNLDNKVCYAYLQGKTDDYIATIGHLDVVPEGNGWKGDPFVVRNIEGWLIGRGVADNKGACILALYVLKFLKDNDIELPYSIRAIMGCDEESGMEDVVRYNETEKAPLFCFTPDANFPVCCGEKGIVSYDLISKEISDRTIVSINAGIASNVIPDKAEFTVKTIKDLVSIDGIEVVKNSDTYTLTATGIGGHAAMPAGTKNAIGMLVNYCLDNEILTNDETEYMQVLTKLHCVTDGSGLGIDADDGLFDPLTCIGGMLKIENNRFIQNTNIRFPTNTTSEKIHSILSAQFTTIGGNVPESEGHEPFYIDPKTPVIKALLDTYNEITNQNKEAYLIGGGTYSRHFPLACAFGIEPNEDELPSFVGSAHMAEEGACIEDLMQALQILILSVDKLLKLDY